MNIIHCTLWALSIGNQLREGKKATTTKRSTTFSLNDISARSYQRVWGLLYCSISMALMLNIFLPFHGQSNEWLAFVMKNSTHMADDVASVNEKLDEWAIHLEPRESETMKALNSHNREAIRNAKRANLGAEYQIIIYPRSSDVLTFAWRACLDNFMIKIGELFSPRQEIDVLRRWRRKNTN